MPTETVDANASADMNSLIDSTLDSVPVETSESDASAEQADATLEAEQPQAEESAQQQAEAAQEQPTEQPVDETDDDLSRPNGMSQNGKRYWYDVARAEKLLSGHKAWRAVEDAVPGATVESIRQMHETQSMVDSMLADYNSGDLDPFVTFWQRENPQAFTQMMMSAPQFLQQNAPQAYQAMEQRIHGGLVDRLYREGQRSGDDTKIAIAQHLDQMLTGKFRDLTKAQPIDALAEREAQLTQRERAINQQLERERQAKVQAFLQDTDKAAEQSVTDLVNAELSKPQLKAFENSPQLNWLRRDLIEAVKSAEQANAPWLRQYEARRKEAQARTSEQARQGLVAMKTEFARGVIARTAPKLIKQATEAFIGKSVATHQKLAAAAAKKEPANTGMPTQGVQVNPALNNAKSMDEMWKAIGW